MTPARSVLGDDLLEGVLGEDVADDRGRLRSPPAPRRSGGRGALRAAPGSSAGATASRGRRRRPRCRPHGARGRRRRAWRGAARRRAGCPRRPARCAPGRPRSSDPTRLSTTRALSSSESGSSSMRPRSRPRPRTAAASSSSGGPRRRGGPGACSDSATRSTRSRKVASPQWTSSKTTTSGRSSRESLEELARAPEDLLDRELPLGEADRGRDALQASSAPGRQAAEPGAGDVRRIVLADAGDLANDLGQRPERDAASVGEAAAACSPSAGSRRSRRTPG